MSEPLSVQCCIAGGGPAGMMLGLLLARAGVSVLVLEKHADFLRDFLGDTLHPSTLEIMHELGLLERFLQLPHQKVTRINAWFGDQQFTVADFSHLPTQCRYVAFMPQWDFLNFLADMGRQYPAFQVRMSAEVTDLMETVARWTNDRSGFGPGASPPSLADRHHAASPAYRPESRDQSGAESQEPIDTSLCSSAAGAIPLSSPYPR